MVEFFGLISDECEKYIVAKKNKATITCFCVASLICIICTTVFGFIDFSVFKPMLFCTLIVVAISVVVSILPLSKARQKQIELFKTEIRITIDENNIVNTTIYGRISRPLEQVKKVIDVGKWYCIVFKGGDIANSWVCQKDLITKGTIEEFEEIFDQKLIKNSK